MLYFYLVLIVLIIVGIRRRMPTDRVFLKKDQTTTINGICIFTVLICHASGYLLGGEFGASGKSVVLKAQDWFNLAIGNLHVAPFLFFSGFGVMEQIQSKGRDYIMAIPRRRILNTLLNFDVAVLCFMALSLILGDRFDACNLILSLMAWSSVGNSNWYVFVIMFCYLFLFVAGVVAHTKRQLLWILFVEIMGFAIFLAACRGYWWWHTIACFVFGVICSVYKERICKWLDEWWCVALCLSLIGYCVNSLVYVKTGNGVIFNLRALFFVACICVFLQRFRINSRPLHWFGTCLFPIYIYQRLPMICLAQNQWMLWHSSLFILISFAVTVVIAWFYRFWQISIR